MPESHIVFMASYKDISAQYYIGEAQIFDGELWQCSFLSKIVDFISGKKEPQVSDWWPTKEIDLADCVDMEINHRNVDWYHAILNKTMEFVEGSGAIFQSWMTNEHSTINLDSSGYEDFAFYPVQLPELLSLVKAITHDSTREAYAEW